MSWRPLISCLALALLLPWLPAGPANAEPASSSTNWYAAGVMAAGGGHVCAIMETGQVRCWGDNEFGQLGYGHTNDIGDNEHPSSAGPVPLGPGRKARSLTAGQTHTCAILDNGTVRCWGRGTYGQLGHADTEHIGDNESPLAVGAVRLGAGRSARALTAGANHTCAILDNGTVRCWGRAYVGQLGYGNDEPIGDDEHPDSAGPVDLGTGRTAVAISAGWDHTCAILDTGDVRCWGYGDEGGLGYASHDNVGLTDTPGSQSPVRLGVGRTARALSAGNFHTCVVLDNGQVRCWGVGDHGRLGYGDTEVIGDNEHPDSVDPVKIGQGRSARAIAAGEVHTCVLLDTSQVRCWGGNSAGILGYGNADPVGDSATPDTAGPVRLGRPARAVTAGNAVTCALLDTDRVRCWGFGGSGRLGYGTTSNIGDNEHPESAGPVALGHRVPSRAVTSLTARPKKKRDRRPPYRFTLTGKVSGLFVAEARSCTGRISVIVKRRKKKVARAATALRHTGATCGYRVKFKTKKKLPGRLKATVRYGGSTNLAPAQRRLRLRAG